MTFFLLKAAATSAFTSLVWVAMLSRAAPTFVFAALVWITTFSTIYTGVLLFRKRPR